MYLVEECMTERFDDLLRLCDSRLLVLLIAPQQRRHVLAPVDCFLLIRQMQHALVLDERLLALLDRLLRLLAESRQLFRLHVGVGFAVDEGGVRRVGLERRRLIALLGLLHLVELRLPRLLGLLRVVIRCREFLLRVFYEIVERVRDEIRQRLAVLIVTARNLVQLRHERRNEIMYRSVKAHIYEKVRRKRKRRNVVNPVK